MSDTDLFWPPAVGQRDSHSTTPLPSYGGEPPHDPPREEQRERPRPWRHPALAAGLAALVFGGVGVGVGATVAGGGNDTPSSSTGLTSSSTTTTALSNDPKSYAAIAARVLPSVVNIDVTGSGQEDTGSGVVLRSDGYILTNNHVIEAATGGGNITVTFNDNSTAAASIVGTDQLDDLAVIKVNKTGLTAATLGSSASVRVGDAVLAVGSPLGLQGTVTSGIVSALNRPVQTQDDSQSQNFFGQDTTSTPTVFAAIQTDAAVNPGNSGGPLVDAAGRVIGINSAIASTGSGSGQSGNIGVGFAIPIDEAKAIAEQLITTGKARHPLLGIQLPADDATGSTPATVQQVTPGGPADKAGIKAGDTIVAVNGVPTTSPNAVIADVRSYQPGQEITVTFTRDGQKHTVKVTLTQSSSDG